ncbi:MAG: SprT-like domain-containing protein [Planctomycetes bacterium]|nr:SprT-like domain-containing protein [Planctomycetota bacterium]
MDEGPQAISVAQLQRDYSPEVLLAAAAAILEKWNASSELAQLKIVWNSRLRTSGGRALLNKQIVELNPRLLAKNQQYIEVVLIHELAHLLAAARFGRVQAHGREWQQLMIAAGQAPDVRHSMDASDFYHRRRAAPDSLRFIRRIFKSLIK